jgi:3-phenylpropionate/cinnamic acid dioxygenase small subunit
VTADYERHYQCVQFYNRESELLDNREFEDWIELLTDDIQYEMPIRQTRELGSGTEEFSENGYYFIENRARLEKRVEKFQTDFAWAEDPPSMTRRFVTNIRIKDSSESEIDVWNNLLIYRAMGGDRRPEHIISAERRDTLVKDGGELLLDERHILLDHPHLRDRMSLFL